MVEPRPLFELQRCFKWQRCRSQCGYCHTCRKLLGTGHWFWSDHGSGSGSSTLQKLTYKTVSDSECKSQWGDFVTEGLSVCVQNTASTGACFGDSGGPLLDSTGTLQYGLVSGGDMSCASGGLPDVYTDVASYGTWIQEQLTSNGCDSCWGSADTGKHEAISV